MEEHNFPCPACGFLVFDEPAGSYEICPVCGWEDDHVQLSRPLMQGGANGGSLFEYQQDILKKISADIKDHEGYKRCSNWRPLTKSDLESNVDLPQTGKDYFFSATLDSPKYYWEK